MARFETSVPLRRSDLDVHGQVDHAAYVDVLQEARVDLLLRGPDGTGPMRDLLGGGVLAAAHQVEYLRPVTAATELVGVQLWAEQIGAARFTIGYELFAEGRLCCQARSVLCPFDLAQQRVRRLTAAERDFFGALADPGAEPLRTLPPADPIEATWSGAANGPNQDIDFRVRWADLDSYGHVNNVRFFDYFDQARMRLLGGQGFCDQRWALARQDVRYLAQLNHRQEPYRLHTAVVHVGPDSVQLAARILDPTTATVFATAASLCVAVGQKYV